MKTNANLCARALGTAVALLLAAASAGCAPFSVRTDYDPSTPFASMKRYDWEPRAKRLSEAPRDPRIDNELVDSRVRRAVDATLVEKGYVLAPADSKAGAKPDFRVNYFIAIEPKFDVHAIPNYYGYGLGWWGGPAYADVYVDQYEMGTLFIDVISPATNTLVWRGSASARLVPDLTPEERETRIQEAVRAVLAKFPPPEK
jgi:hypothetical protein